jgi:hypothetical protein
LSLKGDVEVLFRGLVGWFLQVEATNDDVERTRLNQEGARLHHYSLEALHPSKIIDIDVFIVFFFS